MFASFVQLFVPGVYLIVRLVTVEKFCNTPPYMYNCPLYAEFAAPHHVSGRSAIAVSSHVFAAGS